MKMAWEYDLTEDIVRALLRELRMETCRKISTPLSATTEKDER